MQIAVGLFTQVLICVSGIPSDLKHKGFSFCFLELLPQCNLLLLLGFTIQLNYYLTALNY